MFVAILAALALSSPAPSASPLKQIIEVHAQSTLCATLHQTVAPALAGLMKDDSVIDLGQRALGHLTHGGGDMDRLQMENASLALVHNLKIVDDLLADAKKFPASPKTDDERTASRIKADLESIVSWQKDRLNVIYGTMDSYALGEMQTGFPLFNPTVGPNSDDLVPDMQATPVQTPPPIVAAGISIGPGGSPRFVGSASRPVAIGALEDRASVEILNAAATCASAH